MAGSDSQGNPLAVAVALAMVSAVAVALRFQTRRQRRSGCGVDDWLCLPALVRTMKISLQGSYKTDSRQPWTGPCCCMLQPSSSRQFTFEVFKRSRYARGARRSGFSDVAEVVVRFCRHAATRTWSNKVLGPLLLPAGLYRSSIQSDKLDIVGGHCHMVSRAMAR